MRYARLLHDFQWMKYPSRTVTPGWDGLRSTPETVPLFLTPNPNSHKDDLKLGSAWEEYLEDINEDRAFKFIMWPPAGWFNKNRNADTLGFGGNVVEVLSVNNRSAQVKTFDLAGTPPSSTEFNFETHPEVVHKFTVITKKGSVINPAEGIDSYIFLIGRSPLYVPLNRLEFFPRLPIEIKINLTTIPWLLVKDAPGSSGNVVGKLIPSQKITVHEYAPRGTYVWGRTDLGWIALCWNPKAGNLRYFTSWRMKTMPPVPPKSANGQIKGMK